MQANAMASVSGYVVDVDSQQNMDGRNLVMEWFRTSSTEVVPRRVPVGEDGWYHIGDLEAGEVYLVRIKGVVGIPANVIPQEGDNKRDILWSPLAGDANVDGKVWAYNGTTELGAKQTFGLWDISEDHWNWEPSPTDDQGDWQAPPVNCTVWGGRWYYVYINYGPGYYGGTPDVSEVYVPSSGLPPSTMFRRNSGTCGVKVNNPDPNGDLMQWKSGGVQITLPNFPVDDQEWVLVSAPAANPNGTVYTVRIKPASGTWGQASSPKPFTLEYHPAASDQQVTFNK